MSYVPPELSGLPQQPPSLASPGERARPATVTAAGLLLYGTATLVLVQMILSISVVNTEIRASREAYQGIVNTDMLVNVTRVGGILAAVLDVLVAAAFAIFAYHNMKGRNGIRIATWSLGGLGLLCFGCGAVGSGIPTTLTANAQQTPELREAARRVAATLPNWYTAVAVGVDVALFLSLALVIILLAVPASNAYFRRPQPAVLAYPIYPPIS